MDSLLKSLSEQFGHLGIVRLEKVTKGILSDNYVAFDRHNSRYFLHGHRYEEVEWIKTVFQVEQFFQERGIPIIPPLLTASHQAVWEVEGKYFTLLPFIDGVQYERDRVPLGAIRSMGEMLGRIHRAGSKDFPEIEKRGIEWIEADFHTTAKQILDIIASKPVPDEYDRMAERKIRLQQRLIAANPWKYAQLALPFDHLVHGDFHEYNVFFDGQDAITHVFDWEKTAISPRLFEVARSIDFVCFNGHYEERSFRQAATFLQAYGEAYPYLNEDLRKALYLFHVKNYYSLWMEKAHYLNSNPRPDVFMPIVIKYLEHIQKHLEEVVERIVSTPLQYRGEKG